MLEKMHSVFSVYVNVWVCVNVGGSQSSLECNGRKDSSLWTDGISSNLSNAIMLFWQGSL